MSSLNIQELCKRLGFNTEEVVVYEHILNYGPTKISELSKKTGIVRSTLYLRISGLIQRGFLKQSTKGGCTFISLNKPRMLKEYIMKEKRALKQKEVLIHQMISMHTKMSKDDDFRFATEHLTGIAGFTKLIDKIIAEDSNLYWTGPFEGILNILGDEEFFRLMTWRRMNQKTVSHAITDDSILEYQRYTDSIGKFREIKIINDLKSSKAVFVAFGNYFALVDLTQGVHIMINHSGAMSELFKSIHLLLQK
jgi:predicted DNA-binding transcriptional regulator